MMPQCWPKAICHIQRIMGSEIGQSLLCACWLIPEKRGPPIARVIPVASEIKKFSEDICILDLPFACIRHYSPRRGRQTETALCASREFHPSEDRSGPPARAGVSLCTDEVMAKQLVRCFWTGGYRSPPYLAVFDAVKPHRRVLAHPPGSLCAFQALRQGTYFSRRM